MPSWIPLSPPTKPDPPPTAPSAEEMFDQILGSLESSLESMSDAMHFSTLHAHAEAMWDALTRGGTLLPASASAPPPRQTPGSRVVIITDGKCPHGRGKLWSSVCRRPWLWIGLLSVGGAALLFRVRPDLAPVSVRRLRANLARAFSPPPPRPLITGDGARLEMAIVLGAEPGAVGEAVALSLAERGLCVVASVAKSEDVDQLERRGRGWIKAVVLDDTQPSSVGPFLRSLQSALSLRFPLHSSGPIFLTSAMPAPTVASVVDCLALAAAPERLPLEAETEARLSAAFNSVSSRVLVLRGILPILRRVGRRREDPDIKRTYLALLPSAGELSLPFDGVTAATTQATDALLVSLRRELATIDDDYATTARIEIKTLLVGATRVVSEASLPPARPASPLHVGLSLTPQLESMYAPALRRKVGLQARPVMDSRLVSARVWKMLTLRRGRVSTLGTGFARFLPEIVVDGLFRFEHWAQGYLEREGGSTLDTPRSRSLPVPPHAPDSRTTVPSTAASTSTEPIPPSLLDRIGSSESSGEEADPNAAFSFVSEAGWRDTEAPQGEQP